MTMTFGTNSDNDLYLNDIGNLVVLTGLPAIMAACETAAKAQLGEMVLNVNQGMPDFQVVWKGTPNYPLFAASLRETLQAVPGVNKVENITMENIENVLRYTATISTDLGEAVLNG